jgi:aryl-alcohol dehydrogenase-like predicted oxidoreductase
MRLPTDEQLARDAIAAAAGAGMTVFDTARAYGPSLGHNERVVASSLRAAGREQSARIVTKGGMTRPGGAWVPDGRAKAIAADC